MNNRSNDKKRQSSTIHAWRCAERTWVHARNI